MGEAGPSGTEVTAPEPSCASLCLSTCQWDTPRRLQKLTLQNTCIESRLGVYCGSINFVVTHQDFAAVQGACNRPSTACRACIQLQSQKQK